MKRLYMYFFSSLFILNMLLGLVIVPLANADKWVNLESSTSTNVKIELDRNAVTVGQEFTYKITYKLGAVKNTEPTYTLYVRSKYTTDANWTEAYGGYWLTSEAIKDLSSFEQWYPHTHYDWNLARDKHAPQKPNYMDIDLNLDPFIKVIGWQFSGDAKSRTYNCYSYQSSDHTIVSIRMEFNLSSYQPDGTISLKAVASLFKKTVDKEFARPLDILDYGLTYKNPKAITVSGSYCVRHDTSWEEAGGAVLLTSKPIPLSYTFPVSTVSLHNVKIVDSIPPQTNFLKATGNGQLDIPSQTVVWNLGDMTLEAGEEKKLHCFVQVPRDLNEPAFGWRTGTEETVGDQGEQQTSIVGYIDNNATFQSDEVTFKDKSTVKVVLCGLSIKKTADRVTVGVGKEINYTITYRNIGLFEAEELKVKEQPEQSGILSILNTNPPAEYSEGLLTWSLGTLAAGDKGKVSVLERVESEGPPRIKNFATVSATIAGLPVSATASAEVSMAHLLLVSEKDGLTTTNKGYPDSESTKITVTVKDSNGPVIDDSISFSLEPNLGHLEVEAPTTNSLGEVHATYFAPTFDELLATFFPNLAELPPPYRLPPVSITITATDQYFHESDYVKIDLVSRQLQIQSAWRTGALVPWENTGAFPATHLSLGVRIADMLGRPVEGAFVKVTEPKGYNPGWSMTGTTDAVGIVDFEWDMVLDKNPPAKPIWHLFWIEASADTYESAEKAAIMAVTPTDDWVFHIPAEFWYEMGLEIAEGIGKIPGLPDLAEWAISGAVIYHKIDVLRDPEANEEQKARAVFEMVMEAGSLALHESGLKLFTYLCSKIGLLYELYVKDGISPPSSHNGAEMSVQNGVDSSPKGEIEFHSPVSVVIRNPQGYFIGRDPRLSYVFNDMSLTSTFDDDYNHPVFNMYDVMDGTYIMRIVGTEAGSYSFDVTLTTLDKQLFTQHFTGTITPGEVQWATLQIDSNNPDAPIVCAFASNEGDNPDYEPKADAGGFYVAKNGQSFTLDASTSIAFDSSIVSYEWDLDNDGTFDVMSASPTLTYFRTHDDPVTLRLRVTDSYGLSNVTSLFVVSSIQEAIDLAQPGSVVHVEPGLYQENLIIWKPIELIGADSRATIIDGQTLDNTIRVQADNVKIRGFTVTGSNDTYPSAGIYLDYVKNVVVTDNIVSNNQGHGIFSMWSQRIEISGNIILSNNQGIRIDGSDSQALVYGNYVEDNMQGGIFVYASDSVSIESNTVSNNAWHGISAEGYSEEITIRNNTVTENLLNGIAFGYARNITVEYNRVSDNSANGISPQTETEQIVMRGNILENNGVDGIYTVYSSRNTIVSNVISNQRLGIYLDAGNENIVLNNILEKNGFYVRNSYGNIVTNNTVNGKRLMYIEGAQNLTIEDAGQVILVECSNMTIKKLDLSNVGVGLELWHTNYTTVTDNDFEMNMYGIMLLNSTGNIIYHNNFASNTRSDVYFPAYGQTLPNTWDNGYPSGGNCWSNYTGSDVYHGTQQDLLGSDGIGDTPRILASDNIDNYPIVGNYAAPTDINVMINGTESASTISSNATMTDLTQTPQGLNFTIIGFPGDIAHVLLTLPGPCTYGINITIDDVPLQPPYPIITNNVTHYFVYFEIPLSVHDISLVIVPDNTPPTTSLSVGVPKFIDSNNNIYVCSNTQLNLNAQDNQDGSGVASTQYRIYNATVGTGWQVYSGSFQLTNLYDGAYSIDYYSIDLAGNNEQTRTTNVTVDNTPPTTTLTFGDPKITLGNTCITRDTALILQSSDNNAGINIITYRIYNASYNSGWQQYVQPFKLTGIQDGNYTIEYASTDNLGNVELAHSAAVTLFSWNHIYTDSGGRGTVLKINLAYKFFQFIRPGRDYGIIKATYMKQFGRTITISHLDKQLQLITTAVDTKLDFCVATAWDRQTRKTYFLLDKPGIEK